MKKALTLTIVANMTSNYSEGIGNIASVQKVFKNRKVYSMRSREKFKKCHYGPEWGCMMIWKQARMALLRKR